MRNGGWSVALDRALRLVDFWRLSHMDGQIAPVISLMSFGRGSCRLARFHHFSLNQGCFLPGLLETAGTREPGTQRSSMYYIHPPVV